MMTSQTIQGWHPNPQLMQPFNHQAPAPQGWTGSWPPGGNVAFPPGYPGPPPMPGGTTAHPSWNAGFWQYNPLANVQNPQQPWAPGAGWFPPNFNPYKRIPKPPSPSYWNTKLTDNGLGLEGMVKRKEPSEYNGEEPHTPWIWNPPSLLETGDRATPTRDFNVRKSGSGDSGPPHAVTPTRDHGQSSRGPSQESSSAHAHNQTPDKRSGLRGGYFYNHQENAVTPSGPTRHSSDPSGSGFAGPSASHARAAGQPDAWPNRSRSHPPPGTNEVPPYPAPTPTLSHSRSAPTQQATFTQEPESFTSRGELQTTFSSNIIRTPTHYHQARRSTDEPPPRYHSRSPSGPPGPEPLARQASLPNASTSSAAARGDVYANFTEDLSNSLHATSGSGRTARSAHALSRSRTEPVIANLTTIHESGSALSSGEIFLAPLRDSAGPSSSESSPNPSPRRREAERERDRERAERAERRTSPYASSGPQTPDQPSPLYRDRRASPYAGHHVNAHSHPHLHSRSHSNSHSPSPSPHARTRDHSIGPSGLGRRDSSTTSTAANNNNSNNPLPPPPMERASLEASRPPVQEPSPPRYTRKVRVGFWNRRGDHLTANSFVVYAPHGRAHPEELREYPDERDGYQDQFGTFVPWREERPELPASLPYHGRPPAQPYESFVVYAYHQ